MRNIRLIVIYLLLLCMASHSWAEYPHRGVRRPSYSLGAGGSQYSNRKPNSKGLLTGYNTGQHLLFGIYADGAYSGLPSTLSQSRFFPGGYETGAGIVMEYESNYFTFQFGGGIKWQDVTNTTSDTLFQYENVYDKWGYPFILRYDFHNRTDRMRELFFQLPILAGVRYGHFYTLGGIVVSVPLRKGNTLMRAEGTTTGLYEQFLGLYEEMDNHGLRKNVPFQRSGEVLHLQTDVALKVEIGSEWGHYAQVPVAPRHWTGDWDTRYRVAFFAEFGVRNINPKLDNEYLTIPIDEYRYDFPKYEMRHIFDSNLTKDMSIHNFSVGIKVTVMFGFLIKAPCLICPWSPFGIEADY